ncbi:MAG: hypothetical protein QM750_14205 [Rubrivivax sp.]
MTHPSTIAKPAVAVLALALGLHAANAAESKSLKDQLASLTTDLSMPTTPAAIHIGLSADDVIQPKNRREFELGIAQLYKGKDRPSGSLEFLPYYIFQGGKLPFARYRGDAFFRAMTKTSVGLAWGDGKVGESEVSSKGYSLSSVLLDLSDPIHSKGLQACIDTVQAAMLKRAKAAADDDEAQDLFKAPKTASFTEDDEFRDDQSVKDYKACLTKHHAPARLWNRTRIGIGFAGGSGHEQAGEKRSLRYGNAVWISAQYGFEGLGRVARAIGGGFVDCDVPGEGKQCATEHVPGALESSTLLTLHARRNRGYSDLDLSKEGELARLNGSLWGVRLTYGSDKRNAFIEASRQSVHAPTGTQHIRQHAFGASLKLTDNLWINAISGRRKQFLDEKLQSVTSVNLQFGAAADPLVKPF